MATERFRKDETWLWPLEGGLGYYQSKELYPDGTRKPQPGEVLLVGVGGRDVGFLFVLGRGQMEFAHQAREAWKNALYAIYHSVDLLWQTPQYLEDMPCCELLAKYFGKNAREERFATVGAVDGASFGLPFILAQASKLWGIPVPSEYIGSANVNQEGWLLPVDDIRLKVITVAEKAPYVRYFLVAKDNYDDAMDAVYDYPHLEIKPIKHAKEAFRLVFGEKPRDMCLRIIQNPSKRRSLILDLADITLTHNEHVRSWKPCANVANVILDSTASLSSDEHFFVRLTHAIALRHESNQQGDPPEIDKNILSELPKPTRITIIAHLVQHCADTARPEVEKIIPIAESMIESGKEAFVEHYRLIGALGRLYSLIGREKDALEYEGLALDGFVSLRQFREVSWPLSTMYRLVGILQDDEKFEKLEESRRDIEHRFNSVGMEFVRYGRAFAISRLGREEEAIEEFVNIFNHPKKPELRWSSARHLVTIYHRLGKKEKGQTIREEIEKALQNDIHAIRNYYLVRIDEDPYDNQAIAQLAEIEKGIISHLEKLAKARVEPLGVVISKLFPY